ncbi:MAG: DUF4438 domain-containing protein [Candidatus Eisenbacteria sp.]|nr:DUF4438 domain-containing protein [Candidatus Eisenbacteria bacterium]
MVKTNEDLLVEIGVVGEVAPVRLSGTPYRISPDGEPIILPGTGGITYNVRVGDPAGGWAADHVEPGVSVQSRDRDGSRNANAGLNVLACVGNPALVVSGDAKGGRGVVTGKHGGVEHVLVDFPTSVLDKLVTGDRILVRARGLGLALPDFPEIRIFNLDPGFLQKMGLRIRGGKPVVPVARVIPAGVMGSGLGVSHCYSGDYDIQMSDEEAVSEHGLDKLRLGDIVAITDADHRFGRSVRRGALAVGVVVHTECVMSGHGPGVTTLMAASRESLEFEISAGANIAKYLRIGRARKDKRAAGK